MSRGGQGGPGGGAVATEQNRPSSSTSRAAVDRELMPPRWHVRRGADGSASRRSRSRGRRCWPTPLSSRAPERPRARRPRRTRSAGSRRFAPLTLPPPRRPFCRTRHAPMPPPTNIRPHSSHSPPPCPASPPVHPPTPPRHPRSRPRRVRGPLPLCFLRPSVKGAATVTSLIPTSCAISHTRDVRPSVTETQVAPAFAVAIDQRDASCHDFGQIVETARPPVELELDTRTG